MSDRISVSVEQAAAFIAALFEHAGLPPAAAAEIRLTLSDPTLCSDTRHADELAHIVGDDDQSFAAGMTADLGVMRTTRCSRPLKFRAQLPVMHSRLGSEGQYVETRHEIFNGHQAIGAACQVLCSIV